MKKTLHILLWSCVGIAALLTQVFVSKWATETEKDPDLTETVLIKPTNIPSRRGDQAEALKAHIDALSRIPSRLTGTPGCDEAVQYVANQFRALGFAEPTIQEFRSRFQCTPAPKSGPRAAHSRYIPHTQRRMPGRRAEGRTQDRLVYAGSGSLAEVEGKPLDGATVLVETGAREQWLYLIDTGARAIIFVENERPPRYMDTPPRQCPTRHSPFWMTKAEPRRCWRRSSPATSTRRSIPTRAGNSEPARTSGLTYPAPARLRTTKRISSSSTPTMTAAHSSRSCARRRAGVQRGRPHRTRQTHRRAPIPETRAPARHLRPLRGARRRAALRLGERRQAHLPMRDVSPQGHAAFFGLDLSSGSSRVGLFYAGNFFQQFQNNVKPAYRTSDAAQRNTPKRSQRPARRSRLLFVDTINPAFARNGYIRPDGPRARPRSRATLRRAGARIRHVNDSRFFAATPNDIDVNIDNLTKQVRTLACLLPNAFNVEGRYLKRSCRDRRAR